MGMAAISVMWPGPFEQIFVLLKQGGSIWNFASIGTVVSEMKMFENVDNIQTYTYTYGRHRRLTIQKAQLNKDLNIKRFVTPDTQQEPKFGSLLQASSSSMYCLCKKWSL